MITTSDIEVARRIADCLCVPDKLGIWEDSEEIEGCSAIHTALGDTFGDYEIYCGVTKAVLVFEDYNFVIKIPFYGTWTEDWEDEYGAEFSEFEGAVMYSYECDGGSDYCSIETAVSDLIKETEFADLVPETVYVGLDQNDHSIYMQEKVKGYHDYKPAVSVDSLRIAKSIDIKYKYGAPEWRAAVIEKYGEDTYKAFVDWASFKDFAFMRDMHSGNIGFREDGSPVIFDLSGFKN